MSYRPRVKVRVNPRINPRQRRINDLGRVSEFGLNAHTLGLHFGRMRQESGRSTRDALPGLRGPQANQGSAARGAKSLKNRVSTTLSKRAPGPTPHHPPPSRWRGLAKLTAAMAAHGGL